MGHLESYYFLPEEYVKKHNLKKEDKPAFERHEPEVGVWHTVRIKMEGRTINAWLDGEKIHDNFTYPEWMMSMEPNHIMFQKHDSISSEFFGENNPCPIEFRNIFIKDLNIAK